MRLEAFLVFYFLILNVGFAQPDTLTYTYFEDINYRPADTAAYVQERCLLDLYLPENLKDFATVVWFHGGGLRAGNKSIPDQLKRQGIAVVAANYRLHPHVQAPKYIEDAAAAVAWTFSHIEQYGGRRDLIFVSGHSAGGYLTSMVGLDTSYLQPYGIHPNEIAGLIPYSGHAITHFTIRREMGLDWDQPVVDNYAALYHCRADAPPYIIISGDRELELFGRYEEVAYQARMMKLVGHPSTELYELDGYNHGNMPEGAHPILLRSMRKITNEILGQGKEDR